MDATPPLPCMHGRLICQDGTRHPTLLPVMCQPCGVAYTSLTHSGGMHAGLGHIAPRPSGTDTVIPSCMQVLVLSCERFMVLPSFRTVKHLVVEQPDLQPVLDGLGGLPLLETLSLVNSDESFDYCCDK